jgi:cellulose synthase/poly-beta-1,6-N-acetylglucosamine synthase-like glycosyltransferase
MFSVLTLTLSLCFCVFAAAQIRALILFAMRRAPPESKRHTFHESEQVPLVAIQIATYREAGALPALLRAINALDWPRDYLFVQVIDDSTGKDAEATLGVLDEFSARGMRIECLRRQSRKGFKAGALNFALSRARGADFIAYFDADSRPRPDFLTHLMHRLIDEKVAAIQCRWEFPNACTSPLTALQAAAFEYLFRYEMEIRMKLGLTGIYLGSAAVWRRQAIEELGGYQETPFTAEDVDLGRRAAASSWRILHEPEALADSDAVEDILVFRAQQRRWTRAVGRAALDAMKARAKVQRAALVELFDRTALLPHLSIPVTLMLGLIVAFQVIVGGTQGRFTSAIQWAFTILIIFPPAVVALLLSVRTFHPDDWRRRIPLLAAGGSAAAATMTSFVFGFIDLAVSKETEFVVTAKAGQTATLRGSQRQWVFSFVGPLIFDATVATILLVGSGVALSQHLLSSIVPTTILGSAYAASFCQSGMAFVMRLRRR